MEKKFKLGPLKKRETGSYQFLLQPAYSVQLPCYLWKLITI